MRLLPAICLLATACAHSPDLATEAEPLSDPESSFGSSEPRRQAPQLCESGDSAIALDLPVGADVVPIPNVRLGGAPVAIPNACGR